MTENVRSRKRDLNPSNLTPNDTSLDCDVSNERIFKNRRIDQLIDCNDPIILENWIHNLAKKYDKNYSSNNSNNNITLEIELKGLVKYIEKLESQKNQKTITENKFLATLVKSQQETIKQLQDWEKIANYYLQERNALKAELNNIKDFIALAFSKPKTNQTHNKPPFVHRSPPDIF